jgi:regulator of replication initiation timing
LQEALNQLERGQQVLGQVIEKARAIEQENEALKKKLEILWRERCGA